MLSEIFNDEFKIRSDLFDAIFLQISFDVFQINSADQYEVFESSRAWISAPTPNIRTDVSCDFSQSVQANAGIEVDGLGKLHFKCSRFNEKPLF